MKTDGHDSGSGVRATLAGLALLAASITGAVFVVVRFLFGSSIGIGLAGAVAMSALTLWYLFPRLDRSAPARELD